MAEPGVKDLFATIKKSPALMITAVVFIGIVLYLVIKKGPGGAKNVDTNSGLATGGGSYIQPYIEPIIIQSGGGGPAPVPAGGTTTTPAGSPGHSGGSPGHSGGITMPAASGGSPQGAGGTTNSTGSTGGGFWGILGANVPINTSNNTYTNANGQQVPLPIPPGAKVVQGSQNRVWYVYNNQQYLLTSGNGPADSTLVQAPGTPFVPATTTANTSTLNVTNSLATTNSHG